MITPTKTEIDSALKILLDDNHRITYSQKFYGYSFFDHFRYFLQWWLKYLTFKLEIIEAAAKTGAQALKLQTYTADTMTLDIDKDEFYIDDPTSLWYGRSLYQLYQQAYTPWEWHKAIFDRCKELGIICFSTPFDATAVDFLESLDVPCYKIASFENTDLPYNSQGCQYGQAYDNFYWYGNDSRVR
ncbi:MAG: N-acetylneuraminate synthase family protein [Coleofasciculus chthonoplastes F3-SA18-01]